MSDNTKIEWADATLNFVNGCSLASPGCTNCYAMKQAHRFPVRQGLTTKTKGGMVWTGEVRENPKALDQALRWKRGRQIFWNAHGDLFHESVPDEWIDRQFAVCALTPQHRHLILTKRSDRMLEYLTARKQAKPLMVPLGDGTLAQHPFNNELQPPANVWLGVSVEDQQRADQRIPDLLATPAAVRWLSCEPLLGPVDLTAVRMQTPHVLGFDALAGRRIHKDDGDLQTAGRKLDWIVAGGESGPGARPMHPDWARSLRDQCAAAGVPFFFKQHGDWLGLTGPDGFWPHNQPGACRLLPSGERHPRGLSMQRVGKKRAGRLLDGQLHDAMPEVQHA